MKNLKNSVLAAVVALTAIFSSNVSGKMTEIPELTIKDGIYYIEIDAPNAFGRGYQHGAALKAELKEAINDFDKWIVEHSDYKNSTEFAKDFCSQTSYLQDLKRELPDLNEELKGMAYGSGIDMKVLFLYNSLDEYLAFLMEKGGTADQVAHCTTTGVFGRENLPNFVTHNNDLMTFFRDRVVVSKISFPDSDLVILQTSFVGTFAQNGVNNKGVAVGCNIIVDMERNASGIPVAFNNRKVLETTSLSEAENYLRNIPSAQAMNYMVGDRLEVKSIEVYGDKNVKGLQSTHGSYAIHTNHTLQTNAPTVRDITSKKPSVAKTVERYETAESVLRQNYTTIDAKGMKELKSTKPIRISEKGAISETIESVICEIPQNGNPVMYVTNGLPNGDNYIQFDF